MAEDKRRIWITAICILLGFGAYIYTAFYASEKKVNIVSESRESEITDISSAMIPSEKETGSDPVFPVYICGEVLMPGIYELSGPTYLYVLVDMAGGFTKEADEANIDMVYKIEYAQSIYIPNKDEGEKSDPKISLDTEPPWESQDSSSSSGSDKINVNTDGVEKLCQLPGIGKKTAENIVTYREENGPFSSIEQIMQVPGIGESKFNQIKDFICVV